MVQKVNANSTQHMYSDACLEGIAECEQHLLACLSGAWCGVICCARYPVVLCSSNFEVIFSCFWPFQSHAILCFPASASCSGEKNSRLPFSGSLHPTPGKNMLVLLTTLPLVDGGVVSSMLPCTHSNACWSGSFKI